MKPIKDDLLDLGGIIGSLGSLLDVTETNLDSSTQKSTVSLPLSQQEIKAFEGLCAMENKSPKEKIAELIKNYLEQKRKQMEK